MRIGEHFQSKPINRMRAKYEIVGEKTMLAINH
jgi:hypothetical protein